MKEIQGIGLNYINKESEIYQLKLDKDLKTLSRKFTWSKNYFNLANYYGDLNFMFVEKNAI